jgi:hypothetical protein
LQPERKKQRGQQHMARNNLFIHGLILIVALGLAYYASTPASQSSESGENWISIDEDAIKEFSYKNATRLTRISRIDGTEDYLVEISLLGKQDAEKAAEPEQFKANDNIKPFLSSFRPLRVNRVIGDADKIDLKEFGLKDSQDALTFEMKDGKKFDFVIGKKNYGESNFFLLDQNRKKVILLSGIHLNNIMNAKDRFFERRITAVSAAEAKKAVIIYENNTYKWDNTRKDEKGAPQWRNDQPDSKPNPSYKTWLEKLSRVPVMRFADKKKSAQLANLKPLLQVALQDDAKEIESISIYAETAEPGTAGEENSSFWIKTNYTRGFVATTPDRIPPLLKDLKDIIKP